MVDSTPKSRVRNEFVATHYRQLAELGKAWHKSYAQATPFPNISAEDFFDEKTLEKVLDEFPDLAGEDSLIHNNPRELKYAGKGEKSFGPETRKFMHFLNSEPFLEFLQNLTGIEEKLLPDPYFSGGGLHEIKKGGLLKLHADFNKNPLTGLDRRINVLVYLNKEWKEEYGGHFELWDKDMKQCVHKILPLFNTMAIFSTTDFSYHGHPDPLNCPPDRSRKSLALYYFTNGRPAQEINPALGEHMTIFKARSGSKNDHEAISIPEPINWKAIAKDFLPPIIVRKLTKIK